MMAAASLVAVVGTITGMVAAMGGERGADEARPLTSPSGGLLSGPSAPSGPSGPTEKAGPAPDGSSSRRTSPSASPSDAPGPSVKAGVRPSAERTDRRAAPGTGPGELYRHPDSQVLDWVRDHPGDPRGAAIESGIADRPAAVWFTDPDPAAVTSRVAAVAAGGAARGQVPVLVAYAIPDRDCGGASQGGASGLDAYDAWIDAFAAGLGSDDVIVILEPDAIAQSDCLSAGGRADRFASLARAGRVLKAANPDARVYYDAGHSEWNAPHQQAALLRRAGAAAPAGSDGVFSNVSNFNRTEAEVAYTRRVLDALGAPAGLGAVIDTSRNGNGAPADGEWCDPAGRGLGRPPTLTTGEPRVHAYLWVKLPGESDGCRERAGTFSPAYAYELARG
ncbi:glycoside hydrolase family 6 protein [Streptomyces caniscabiei]|nr:glycoside hydrolase family 6 protein [Streptomyces caniscabiei]MDX3509534.1 glycoside hydrolase family 6 protein [Streptomyces caniscabiei]MDX3723144.1 glycoside hydrolase family 6 protein [Streptomyces caniscabiei]WEO30218.1 glycoside hydrolase family 6 protein [Streptomyces caniscabiei]